MARTTYKLESGKYLHMPTQSIIQNLAHGEWELRNSEGTPIGKFGSKTAALNLLNRGNKTHAASNGASHRTVTVSEDFIEDADVVEHASRSTQGTPANAPEDMTRIEYLTRVVQAAAPPPAGRMYIVLEIPST